MADELDHALSRFNATIVRRVQRTERPVARWHAEPSAQANSTTEEPRQSAYEPPPQSAAAERHTIGSTPLSRPTPPTITAAHTGAPVPTPPSQLAPAPMTLTNESAASDRITNLRRDPPPVEQSQKSWLGRTLSGWWARLSGAPAR
jgi:hypothetical protein